MDAVNFMVGDQGFKIKKFNIGNPPDGGYICPGLMNTGTAEEVMSIHNADPLLVGRNVGRGYLPIPYSHLLAENGRVFGDYTSHEGQVEFMETEAIVRHEQFNPPSWASDLWRFSQLKQCRTFTKDEILACLLGYRVDKGKLKLVIGPGKYSNSFYTMGSEGIRISVNEDEKLILSEKLAIAEMSELIDLEKKLSKIYGPGKTIREIIFSKYGTTAPFNDEIYNFVIGVAGLVLTRDNEFVFALRGKNVSINRGINVTASGAASFDPEALEQHGFPAFIGREMHREAYEEVGLNAGYLIVGAMKERIKLEIGINDSEYDLIPVGFMRELPRGGSPEAMFLIKYHGSTLDLVRTITNNPHPGKKEIERYVYAQPLEEAERLIKTKGGDGIIQHKCVLNMILILEYLKRTKLGG